MFLRKAAIRPVPRYAVVSDLAIDALESQLETEGQGLQDALDAGYRELDRKQPRLGRWLAREVSDRSDELAQSLGYFLAVSVYLAFREAFPTRLTQVDDNALAVALETLEADEQLRADDPLEVLDSDDVIALGQPVILEYVQHHMQEAVAQSGEEADLEQLDRIYRAILVEVIALSHAVEGPPGEARRNLA